LADNALQIQVVVDASQANTGFAQVATSAEQMADKLRASGLGANELSSALKNLGFSSEETSAALGSGMPPAVERATQSLRSMSGGAAMARVELAALSGSAGAAEMGLARLAGTSATLAPIIAMAFPLFGAIALGEILGTLIGKLGNAGDEARKMAGATEEMEFKATQAMRGLAKESNSLDAEISNLTSGKLAELSTQLRELKGAAEDDGSAVHGLWGELNKLETTDTAGWAENFWKFLKLEPQSGDKALAQQLQNVITPANDAIKSLMPESQIDELQSRRAQVTQILSDHVAQLQKLKETLPDYAPEVTKAQANIKLINDSLFELDSTMKQLEVGAQNRSKEITVAGLKETMEAKALQAEADKQGYEDDRKMQEQAAKDQEASLRLIKQQIDARAELFRQKSADTEQSADAFKPGSSQRIDAEKQLITQLQEEQRNADAAMVADKAAGNDKLYALDSEYYRQITSLLDQYKAKVITETRVWTAIR
jgi:hypothetical protein